MASAVTRVPVTALKGILKPRFFKFPVPLATMKPANRNAGLNLRHRPGLKQTGFPVRGDVRFLLLFVCGIPSGRIKTADEKPQPWWITAGKRRPQTAVVAVSRRRPPKPNRRRSELNSRAVFCSMDSVNDQFH